MPNLMQMLFAVPEIQHMHLFRGEAPLNHEGHMVTCLVTDLGGHQANPLGCQHSDLINYHGAVRA